MKKAHQLFLKRISLVLLIGFVLNSFADELDQQRLDSLFSETFWSSESNALTVLIGVYRRNISHGQRLPLPIGGADVSYYFWWLVTKKNFRQDADYQWPIPQEEVNINTNLAE